MTNCGRMVRYVMVTIGEPIGNSLFSDGMIDIDDPYDLPFP